MSNAAGESIARFDLIENTLEVQLRLFIRPSRVSPGITPGDGTSIARNVQP